MCGHITIICCNCTFPVNQKGNYIKELSIVNIVHYTFRVFSNLDKRLTVCFPACVQSRNLLLFLT